MVVSGLLSLALPLWLVGGVVVPVLRKNENLEGVVCLKQRSFCRKIYENFGACAYNEIKKNKKKQKILRIQKKAQEVSYNERRKLYPQC